MIPADLRYALRALLAAPSFTAVVVISLALAMATNITMFSVADAMFLRFAAIRRRGTVESIAGRRAGNRSSVARRSTMCAAAAHGPVPSSRLPRT